MLEPRSLPVLRSLKQVVAGYAEAGLPRHAGRVTSRSLTSEFWGGLLDGTEGKVRPRIFSLESRQRRGRNSWDARSDGWRPCISAAAAMALAKRRSKEL